MSSQVNTVTDDRPTSTTIAGKRSAGDAHVIKVQPLKRSEMQVRNLMVLVPITVLSMLML